MRIVIDLQGCQSDSRSRGIGRYSLSLAQNMIKQLVYRDHDVWVILSDNFPDTIEPLRSVLLDRIPAEKILVFKVPNEIAGVRPENSWRMRVAEQIREYFIAALQPDYIHVSSLFEGWGDDAALSIGASNNQMDTAVTLYDLIPYVLDDIYLQDEQFKAFYLRKVDQLKKANLLFAISEHSRTEAIELLDIDPDRVVNISSAIEPTFEPVTMTQEAGSELLSGYKIDMPFVLYVPGGFDPRKNFERLIQAFAQLPATVRNSHQLVVASKLYEGHREMLNVLATVHDLPIRQMVLTDYVSDKDLIALYSLCTLYVFPSIHEGFGLPALEAMACGAPVIGSNTTSIPEVIGLEAALFDPYSADDISSKMCHALTDEKFLASLRVHARAHAKKFSWEHSAAIAVEALELAHEKSVIEKSTSNSEPRDCDQVARNILNNLEFELNITKPSTRDLSMLKEKVNQNFPVIRQRQLFVDISQLVTVDAKSGIQRVVRSILLELLTNKELEFSVVPVYSQAGKMFKQAMAFKAEFLGLEKPSKEDPYIAYSEGDVFIGLDLTAHLFPVLNKVLEQMRSSGVVINYVVYDLTPLVNPEWHSEGTARVFIDWIDSLAKYSDRLICISKSVADDVRVYMDKHYPQQMDRLDLKYFHLGADIQSSVPTDGMPSDSGQILETVENAISFLAVATIEPRKGFNQLFGAFELLWQQGHDVNLVIVGKAGWNVDALIEHLRVHPELGKRLFWLESISDEYLEKIYDACDCLVAASEAEGFGLPLIEAAQHSLSIIARDIPVFREVAGDSAHYFSGLTASELASSLDEWLSFKKLGREPLSDNMNWLTWEQSTIQLVDAILVNVEK
jgi:glycosyltransferase involved in cell wall biosynthesis